MKLFVFISRLGSYAVVEHYNYMMGLTKLKKKIGSIKEMFDHRKYMGFPLISHHSGFINVYRVQRVDM